MLNCSFCGLTQAQVKQLVAGPNVWICDRCVQLSAQLVAGAQDPNAAAPIDSKCKAHPGVAAAFSCARCGTFCCLACERWAIGTETRGRVCPDCIAKIPAARRKIEPNSIAGL